jgi:hypothetical protein
VVKRLTVIAILVVLAGCSSAQSFTDVEGSMRISGQLDRPLMDLQHTTLSLYLTGGYRFRKIDAREIEVHTPDGHTISPKRAQLGSYSATIPDSDRIDVLVLARDEAARLSLKRE